MTAAADHKLSLSHLFSDRSIAAMFGLGFSSGIPFMLIYVTQSAWLSEAKVPIAMLGLMSELTLAYKFKFLWAPFLDRYDAPVFSRLLGRRRGWIIVSQIGVMLALAGVAFGDPANWLAWTVAFSLALGFAGATQDIVIDGWRITVAPKERQGLMTSWAEFGWRIGNLAAGAGALYLSDAFGWRAAYLCMAALMAPGMIAALLAPEPASDFEAHKKPLNFVATIVDPIKDLIVRLGPTGRSHPDHGGRVSHARLSVQRHGDPAVQEPELFQQRHRHGDETVRLLDGAVRNLFRRHPGHADRHDGEPAVWNGRRLRLASEPRLARGHAAGQAAISGPFATHRQHRQFRLCLRLHRAHHLHVVADLRPNMPPANMRF